MPAATSSTWTMFMPRSGNSEQRHPAGEEVVHLPAEGGVVVGPVDAAGLDDHARQPVVGDQPLGDRCASYFVCS